MNTFNVDFTINEQPIGAGHPTYFIAEAGVAHFGDPGKAIALVDLAADAGADAFKTQAFTTDDLISSRLPEWRDRLRPKEVDLEFLMRMKERCDDHGLTFLCTAHNDEVLPWLDALKVPAHKVGSGERGNLPYFKKLAKQGLPLIVSTGMYTQADVVAVVECLKQTSCKDLAFLHCVTSYPVPYEQVNLKAMDQLRTLFPGPVGYSDHTEGFEAALAAVALGADIIEKHITLDYNVPNAQDWKVSAGPDNLHQLIRQIRNIDKALGSQVLGVQPCEEPALEWALKSLVAADNLEAGTVLAKEMVVAKRPGGGLSPAELDAVLGRSLKRHISVDEAFTWEMLD